MQILEGHNLHRFFRKGDDEIAALLDVSICVEEGEIVALVGASGSGKSTLLACLAGLDDPDGGFATVAGNRISHRSDGVRSDLRGRHIGMLMQSGTLIDHLTVRENLLIQQHVAASGKMADASLLLSLLGITSRADEFPRALSGGEAARAGLAVALSTNSPILICDEPTAEVDGATEAAILDEIERRRDGGTAVLIATHSRAVSSRADRIVRLVDGRLADG